MFHLFIVELVSTSKMTVLRAAQRCPGKFARLEEGAIEKRYSCMTYLLARSN